MKTQDDMNLFFYLHYLGRPFLASKKAFTTAKGLVVTIPTLAYVSTFHIENQALLFLGIAFFVDFITGLMVSFKIAKENAIKNNKYKILEDRSTGFFSYLRFLVVKVMFKIRFYAQVISSRKIKMSILKSIVYMMAIVLAKTIQSMFKVKPFSLSFSDAEWSITLIVICICIACEAHSIFIENFKKLGYDFLDKIFSLFRTYNKYKKEIE